MKYRVFLIFIQLALINSFCNSQSLDWVGQISGGGDQAIRDLVIEPSTNNIYVSGSFDQTTDFDLSISRLDVNSNGGSDVFLAKYDSLGELIWVKTFGGTLNDFGREISLGPNGEIFLVGYFDSTVDFDPSPQNTYNLSTQGKQDIFVSKFDTSGNWIWSKSFGGNEDDYAYTVISDPDGDVYIGGEFSNNIDFNPSNSNGQHTNNNSGPTGFIVGLFGNGSYKWSKIDGLINTTQFRNLVYDLEVTSQGELITLTKLNFPYSTPFETPDGRHKQIRVSKLSTTNGNVIWMKELSTDLNQHVSARLFFYDMCLDNSGNIYFGGYIEGGVNLEPINSNNQSIIVSSERNGEGLIVKYDSNMNLQWVNRHTTINKDNQSNSSIYGIDFRDNYIVTSGQYWGSFHLDTSKSRPTITSKGNNDIFIGLYDIQSGALSSQSTLGGSGVDLCIRTKFVGEKSILFTGHFENTVSFNPEDNTKNILTASGSNSYLQRLTFCPKSYNDLTITSCNDYFSPSGKKYITSGLYSDTLINRIGCDSIINIDLTINDLDTSVNRLGDQLIASLGGASTFYQWVDCDDDYSTISGATSQSFTPSQGGRYAVIILKNNCQDTSKCILSSVGLNEYGFAESLDIFPNPSHEAVHVSFKNYQSFVKYELYNILGEKVLQGEKRNIKSFQIQSNDFLGVYQLRVINNVNESAVFKVVFK